jgi:hypothetical protein
MARGTFKWIYAYEYGMVEGRVNRKINELIEEVNGSMKRWIISLIK